MLFVFFLGRREFSEVVEAGKEASVNHWEGSGTQKQKREEGCYELD